MDELTIVGHGRHEYRKHNMAYIILQKINQEEDIRHSFVAVSRETRQVAKSDTMKRVDRLIRKLDRSHVDFCLEHGFHPFHPPSEEDESTQYKHYLQYVM